MKLSNKPLATSSIEPLESRIAPATFLVSGGSGAGALKIFKLIGNFPTVPTDALTAAADATNQGAAAITFSGATATALLNAGDKLYFDTNGDQVLASTGEPLLVQVKSGKARVFWTDSTSTGTQGQLEASELTGILVSGGSKLEVTNTDVFGSILTGLDATGTFTTNGASLIPPLAASIAKLTVTGAVFGDIGATGSISNVVLGKQITSSAITGGLNPSSVNGVFAGSAVDHLNFDLDGSSNFFKSVDFSAFYQAAPVAGAFVDSVSATGSVGGIFAGNGSDVPTGAGRPGGRIEGINITGQIPSVSIEIVAGAGGAGKSGGAGGNVQLGKLTGPGGVASLGSAFVSIAGGAGGQGSVTSGGAGGPVLGSGAGLNISLGGDFNELVVFGGQGGNGVTAGGAGGMVKGLKLNFSGAFTTSGPGSILANTPGVHQIRGGLGGDASGATGTGGAGGMVLGINYKAMNGAAVLNQLNIFGGAGGKGTAHNGGAGGILDTASVTFMGSVLSRSEFGGGVGGDGEKTGGAGGMVKSVTAFINKAASSTANGTELLLGGGNGGNLLGNAAIAGSAAGRGGDVQFSKLTVNTATSTPSSGGVGVVVQGGNGGTAGMTAGNGGEGADIISTTLVLGTGDMGVGFEAGAGQDGGSHSASNGKGGAGGDILDNSGVTATNITGGLSVNWNQGGQGGNGSGTGAGGLGGKVDKFNYSGSGLGVLLVGSGYGGNGGGNGGVGASGGAISNSTFTPAFITDYINFYAGSGGGVNVLGAPGSTSGGAGAGGAIKNVTVQTGVVAGVAFSGAAVEVFAGRGGETDKAGAFAGAGGAIMDFQLQTQNVAGSMSILAGDGGNGIGASGNVTAKGGIGGKLEDSTFNFGVVTGWTQISAGRGGDGTSGGLGGDARKNSLTLAGVASGIPGIITLDPLAAAQSVQNALEFKAGDGGAGVASNANGGIGGSFSKNKATVTGAMNNGSLLPGGTPVPLLAILRAGDGGQGGMTGGNGGAGGVFFDVDFEFADVQQGLVIARAGDGGKTSNGTGGHAGLLGRSRFEHYGNSTLTPDSASLLIRGGHGGAALSGSSHGGSGGTVGGLAADVVSLQNFGALNDLTVAGGPGGAGPFDFNLPGPGYNPNLPSSINGNGNGGNAGGVTYTKVMSFGDIGTLNLLAGSGGNAGGLGGNGGLGGSNQNNTIAYYGATAPVVFVNAGSGGDAQVSGTGGDSGSVEKIALDVSSGIVSINEIGSAGPVVQAGDGAMKAGSGRKVDKISGIVNELYIYGANAGETLSSVGNGGGAAGIPGNGSSVTNVNLPVVNLFVQTIQAGSGSMILDSFASGPMAGVGGTGGSVRFVQVNGVLGVLLSGASSGGLTGTHGSVKNVQAAHIGSISASDSLSNLLPVSVLDQVFVTQSPFIGDDFDSDGLFDYTPITGNPPVAGTPTHEAPGLPVNFVFGTDQADDNLVVVKAGGYGTTSPVLKLILL